MVVNIIIIVSISIIFIHPSHHLEPSLPLSSSYLHSLSHRHYLYLHSFLTITKEVAILRRFITQTDTNTRLQEFKIYTSITISGAQAGSWTDRRMDKSIGKQTDRQIRKVAYIYTNIPKMNRLNASLNYQIMLQIYKTHKRYFR